VSADLPEAPSSPETEGTDAESTSDPQAGMGRQLLWMVGVGLVLVLGFFFATQWSQQYEWGGDGESSAPAAASGGSTQGPTAAQGPESTPDAGPAQSPGGSGAAPSGSPQGPPSGAARGAPPTPDADLSALVDELSGPVEGPVADKIDSLRTRLSGVQGSRARELRAQLVRLYIGAGTPGRAALTQRQLAEATGSVEDRRRAADLLYRWMRQVEQQGDRARIADVATHVATAYRAVVEQRPQDLDARTRMGEAYLLTNSPMRGIRAINQVLEDDSTFVPARFQKGLALLQINRIDQAVAEFEAVKRHAGRQDPFYKQAQRAIDVIRERTSSSGQSGASGAQ
jgi:hypothetical protein